MPRKTPNTAKSSASLRESEGESSQPKPPASVAEVVLAEVEDLWEEMEGSEVGGDSSSDDDGGVVGQVILVRRGH